MLHALRVLNPMNWHSPEKPTFTLLPALLDHLKKQSLNRCQKLDLYETFVQMSLRKLENCVS